MSRPYDLNKKRRDFLHKLSNYYAWEYEFVAVEDLNVEGILESPVTAATRRRQNGIPSPICLNTNASEKGRTSRRLTLTALLKSALSVASNPKNRCGCVSTPGLPVGFEADRDANAAWNILSRGLSELGVGHFEGTPVETAFPTLTPHQEAVSAKRVVEPGSPCLEEVAVSD